MDNIIMDFEYIVVYSMMVPLRNESGNVCAVQTFGKYYDYDSFSDAMKKALDEYRGFTATASLVHKCTGKVLFTKDIVSMSR